MSFEAGVCPKCGSDNVDYVDSTLEDDNLYYYFRCLKCGTDSIDIYDVTYVKTEASDE